MTAVQGQDIENLMSLGEDHDRRVCETNPKVFVPIDYPRRQCDVLRSERLEVVRTSGYLGQDCLLRLDPNARTEEVVELSQDKRREQKWSS